MANVLRFSIIFLTKWEMWSLAFQCNDRKGGNQEGFSERPGPYNSPQHACCSLHVWSTGTGRMPSSTGNTGSPEHRHPFLSSPSLGDLRRKTLLRRLWVTHSTDPDSSGRAVFTVWGVHEWGIKRSREKNGLFDTQILNLLVSG